MKKIIRNNLGVYFMLIGSASFAVMGVFAKLLAEQMSSIEVMFFRNVLSLALMAAALARIAHRKAGGRPWLLIFRGVCGTLSLYAFFYNVSNISLGSAFTFQKTNPLFVALIAWLILRERLSLRAVAALLLAFAGVVLISSPGLGGGIDAKNAALGIASGFFAAVALTSMRQLAHNYNTETIAMSFFFFGTILPIASMLAGEFAAPDTLAAYDFALSRFVMPAGAAWLYIAAMAYCSYFYQLCVTKAYRASKKAGIVAGVSYADVIFTLALGMMLGDAAPTLVGLCGMAMILFGGLALAVLKG